MGRGTAEKPPTGSLYPRESYVCFFIFLVELASVTERSLRNRKCKSLVLTKLSPIFMSEWSLESPIPKNKIQIIYNYIDRKKIFD